MSYENVLSSARRHIELSPLGSIVYFDKYCFINSNGTYRFEMIDFIEIIRDRYTILIITDEVFPDIFYQLSGLRSTNIVLRKPGFSDIDFMKEFVYQLNANRREMSCGIITNIKYCLIGTNFIIHKA